MLIPSGNCYHGVSGEGSSCFRHIRLPGIFPQASQPFFHCRSLTWQDRGRSMELTEPCFLDAVVMLSAWARAISTHRMALSGTVLPKTLSGDTHIGFVFPLFSSKRHLRITFPFLESRMPLHDFCSFLATVLLKTDCGVCGCDPWPHFSSNSKVGFLKGLSCRNPLYQEKGRKITQEAVSVFLLYI